jgi:hypothetical protein
MSNPIADDADYFTSRHQGFHRTGAPNPLKIQYNDTSTPSHLFSPSSPVTRRQPTQATALEATPHAKWQNLIQRLSSFQANQDSSDTVEDGPHRSLWDMPSQGYNSPADQDDTLPTPEQCYQEDEILQEGEGEANETTTDDKENFFANPFAEVDEVDVQEPPSAHIRKPKTATAMDSPQLSTPNESIHSERPKNRVLSALMGGRRRSSGSFEHDIMQMTATQGSTDSPMRHSSAPIVGKLFSKFFPISRHMDVPNATKNVPKHSMANSIFYIPSVLIFDYYYSYLISI